MTRIRLDLEEYDFTMKHISGKDNVVADALSRISIDDIKDIYEDYPILRISTSNKMRKCKSKAQRHSNPVVVMTTRSMTKTKTSPKQNEETTPILNVHVFETTVNKKLPRARVTDITSVDGKIKTNTVSIYLKHKRIFNVLLKSAEKVNLMSSRHLTSSKAKQLHKTLCNLNGHYMTYFHDCRI